MKHIKYINCKIIIIIVTLLMTNFVNKVFANPDLCGFYSHDLEEKYFLPHNLLLAIAVFETGKFDRENHKRESWAWTVSTGGKNKIKYSSKALAIKHILNLQKSKIYNINIGCLQLNYQLYSSALGKPYQALSPAVNMKYGAKLLKGIYDRTQDWKTSVEFFHQANYKTQDTNYYNKVQKELVSLNNYEHNQEERKRSHQKRMEALATQRNTKDQRKRPVKNYSVGKPNVGGRYEKENVENLHHNFIQGKDKTKGYTPKPLDTKRTEELNKLNKLKFKQQHPTTKKLYRHHSNEAPTVLGGSNFFNKHNSK